ncbi:MAG: translation initiation factor IF-3 [Thermodesulfobacteriota bacterium]
MNCKIAKKKARTKLNKEIRASELRVIDSEGSLLGIMSSDEALSMAMKNGLDLVAIAPDATPPVCKIMDYGKYKYQMNKKAHEAKKRQAVVHVKDVKVRPQTEEHDLHFKIKHIIKFLQGGDKTRVFVFFKGREITHPELGRNILERIASQVEEFGVVEQYPKFEGRRMTMVIAPIVK